MLDLTITPAPLIYPENDELSEHGATKRQRKEYWSEHYIENNKRNDEVFGPGYVADINPSTGVATITFPNRDQAFYEEWDRALKGAISMPNSTTREQIAQQTDEDIARDINKATENNIRDNKIPVGFGYSLQAAQEKYNMEHKTDPNVALEGEAANIAVLNSMLDDQYYSQYAFTSDDSEDDVNYTTNQLLTLKAVGKVASEQDLLPGFWKEFTGRLAGDITASFVGGKAGAVVAGAPGAFVGSEAGYMFKQKEMSETGNISFNTTAKEFWDEVNKIEEASTSKAEFAASVENYFRDFIYKVAPNYRSDVISAITTYGNSPELDPGPFTGAVVGGVVKGVSKLINNSYKYIKGFVKSLTPKQADAAIEGEIVSGTSLTTNKSFADPRPKAWDGVGTNDYKTIDLIYDEKSKTWHYPNDVPTEEEKATAVVKSLPGSTAPQQELSAEDRLLIEDMNKQRHVNELTGPQGVLDVVDMKPQIVEESNDIGKVTKTWLEGTGANRNQPFSKSNAVKAAYEYNMTHNIRLAKPVKRGTGWYLQITDDGIVKDLTYTAANVEYKQASDEALGSAGRGERWGAGHYVAYNPTIDAEHYVKIERPDLFARQLVQEMALTEVEEEKLVEFEKEVFGDLSHVERLSPSTIFNKALKVIGPTRAKNNPTVVKNLKRMINDWGIGQIAQQRSPNTKYLLDMQKPLSEQSSYVKSKLKNFKIDINRVENDDAAVMEMELKNDAYNRYGYTSFKYDKKFANKNPAAYISADNVLSSIVVAISDDNVSVLDSLESLENTTRKDLLKKAFKAFDGANSVSETYTKLFRAFGKLPGRGEYEEGRANSDMFKEAISYTIFKKTQVRIEDAKNLTKVLATILGENPLTPYTLFNLKPADALVDKADELIDKLVKKDPALSSEMRYKAVYGSFAKDVERSVLKYFGKFSFSLGKGLKDADTGETYTGEDFYRKIGSAIGSTDNYTKTSEILKKAGILGTTAVGHGDNRISVIFKGKNIHQIDRARNIKEYFQKLAKWNTTMRKTVK
jgi:outer membrane lipoprotein SlyB